jgi:DNA-binding XRE family transcriptional regulator
MSLINQRFKEIRKELGYTQEEYGKVLSIKRSSVGAYEEFRAIVPVDLVPKIMDLAMLPMEDMYDFLFDAGYTFKNEDN